MLTDKGREFLTSPLTAEEALALIRTFASGVENGCMNGMQEAFKKITGAMSRADLLMLSAALMCTLVEWTWPGIHDEDGKAGS